MKKSSALFAAVAFLSTLANASSIPRPTITTLPETRINIHRVDGGALETGTKSGTLSFRYAVTYSNSCVAGKSKLTPITLVEYRQRTNGAPERTLKILLRNEWRGGACPMHYQPVTQRLHTEIANLGAGERYQAEVIGMKDGLFDVVSGR